MLKTRLGNLRFGKMFIGSCVALDRRAVWASGAGRTQWEKKHYSLKTHHLTSLVRYVQDEGGVLETHDDVPNWIREQLYAEEWQKLERQSQKCPDIPGTNTTPININLLPSQSSHTMCADTTATPPMTPPLDVNLRNCPKIPGP